MTEASSVASKQAKMEESPIVSPQDRVSILWPMDDGSMKPFDGVVTHCNASRRKRHGERFRYTIQFADGDIRKTRLRHLAWRRLDLAHGALTDEHGAPTDGQRSTAHDSPEQSKEVGEALFLRRPSRTSAGFFPAGSVRCPFSPELRCGSPAGPAALIGVVFDKGACVHALGACAQEVLVPAV